MIESRERAAVLVAEFELPAHPASTAWARAWVVDSLRAWGLEQLTTECLRSATEMVNGAVRAATLSKELTVLFRLRLTPAHLIVEVGKTAERWELA